MKAKKLLKDLKKAFSTFFKSKKRSYTHKCDVCGKKYKGAANCRKHLRNVHPTADPASVDKKEDVDDFMTYFNERYR